MLSKLTCVPDAESVGSASATHRGHNFSLTDNSSGRSQIASCMLAPPHQISSRGQRSRMQGRQHRGQAFFSEHQFPECTEGLQCEHEERSEVTLSAADEMCASAA